MEMAIDGNIALVLIVAAVGILTMKKLCPPVAKAYTVYAVIVFMIYTVYRVLFE